MERQTGRRPKDLDGPDLPADLGYVWSWFVELSNARTSNGFGANPLSFSEIADWSRLTGTIVRPDEVRLIKSIDRLWLESVAEAREEHERWREQQRRGRA